MADKAYFLDVRFDRMPSDEAVSILLAQALARNGQRVSYANAHTMVTAAKTPELLDALHNSDMVLADGSGVRWGSALVGTPLIYNNNGTDLVPALCAAGASAGLSVYLLGGKPGVAEEAAARLQAAHPGLVIAGSRDGYFAAEDTEAVLATIRAAQPHLLLVAMGVPKQEMWIAQHADMLPGVMCMGVGGLFDFLAQRVRRAPRVLRATGMEWCWRLLMEPGRLWQRYLIGNLVFIMLVLTHTARRRAVEQPALTLIYSNDAPADGAAFSAYDYPPVEYQEARPA